LDYRATRKTNEVPPLHATSTNYWTTEQQEIKRAQ